ncbi:MAG: hypothetical protein AAGH68_06660 [Pseudomonadota bacterium]
MKNFVCVAILALAVSGCATWSTSNVRPADGTGTAAAATQPAQIQVTKDDITDRPYEVLGDINVTVNKTTIFHPDPTPALVDQRLREEAAALGADAVVLVRYGTVGVTFTSWGSLDGNGRAVRFVQ